MKYIEEKSIDLILCDLPYGVTSKNKWDEIIPFEQLWKEYNRIIKDHGAIILHSQQPFTSMLIVSNSKMFKYCWIWNKSQTTGFLNAKKQPLRQHEDICVFYKKQCTYNPQMVKGKMQLKNTGGDTSNYNASKAMPHYSDMYYPKTILNIPQRRFKNGHPTQKPVELEEYLIRTYTNKNDVVLDNCMGSGTTIVAAINENRQYIGFEKDSTYFNMAEDRINNTYNKLNKVI